MSLADESRRTAPGYFNAWTSKRPDEAVSFLADDLAFCGSTNSYSSAEQFRPVPIGFAGMTRRAQLSKPLVESD
jgi:hypothetical protein